MAAPGAIIETPRCPSNVGPHDDHVYAVLEQEEGSNMLCADFIRLFVTSAATPMVQLDVPPGEPTVDRQGPLFPADETKIMPYLLTSSSA